MKKLLINGCSFGQCWTPSKEFVAGIGMHEHVNISKPGTSFQRTIRSTIEWIAQNGKPNYVLIPITFCHRWELALSIDQDKIDGSWIPLQNSNYLDIILLSAYLDHNKIPYLMWDMCNDFDTKHIKGYKGFEKINIIKQNPRIIDLWSFCGNRFMWDTLDTDVKKETDKLAHHHEKDQYLKLENRILEHIKTNNL